MKKQYLIPDVRFLNVGIEVNFLQSNLSTGNAYGEDLDDANPFDPWS